MTFQEQLQRDLDQVFFNPNEFGEKHTLGGQPITCVVDNDRLFNTKNEGTFTAEVLLFVQKDQIKSTLVPYSTINFDGEIMTINDVYEDSGVYQLALERLYGKFTHDIVIQRQQPGTDSSGFKTNTWVHYHRCLAYMKNLTGNETNASNAEIGKVTTLFKIPYINGITHKMRVSYGGQLYDIKYVDDIEGKHEYLDIRCEVKL